MDENGTAQWTYSHSTILENYAGYFTNYQNVTSKLWEWLPAPVLEGADLDTYLEPVIGTNGEMLYTFTWEFRYSRHFITGISGIYDRC